MAIFRTASALVLFASALGTAFGQSPTEKSVSTQHVELTDEVLQTLKVERAIVEHHEALAALLAKAIHLFEAGDGTAALKSLREAPRLDAKLPDGDLLLARLLAHAQAKGIKLPSFDREPRQELLQEYEQRSNKTYEASKKAGVDTRRPVLESSLAYSRALVALQPEDPTYRFNVGYLLQELGDRKSAQAIMDELAPRNNQGFAKAHLWQADQLLSPDRPLTSDSLDAAEAHLLQAMATYKEPQEIHRRLGELYYYRYVRYNARNRDPWVPAREVYLTKAEFHLSKVVDMDVKLALTLAEIRALQGRTDQAEKDVQAVIDRLKARLSAAAEEVESRLSLAKAYRMLRRFDEAIEVLKIGQKLSPDVRLDQELSAVYYFKSLDLQRLNQPRGNENPENPPPVDPATLQQQFQALQDACRAFPNNNYVVHRLVQALTSSSADEAEAARRSMRELEAEKFPGSIVLFLLGFDDLRQGRAAEAEARFAKLRAAKPDGVQAVIAGLSNAVLNGQMKSLNPTAVNTLFEAALRVWPDDPDLLSVRAQQHLLLRQYAQALGGLEKALKARPDDAKLHEMIAVTFERLGQIDQARKHREQAAQLRSNPVPSPATTKP